MFFALSKTLDVVLLPLTWVAGLLFAALILARKRPGTAFGLGAAALAVLLVCSSGSFANACTRAIELPLLRSMKNDVIYDAAVVLGGVMEDASAELSGRPELNEASERLLVGYELLRTERVKKLILSGGSAPDAKITEAAALADQLRRLGADMDAVIVENESRNTRENATYSKTILEREGATKVLIITSAFHMRRSLGCFRAVGLDPDTYSVDVHSVNARGLSLFPAAHHLEETTVAIHELVGRWVYRARGYAVKVDE